MKPTRIVKPPYDKLNKERKWATHLLCDDGKEYTMMELSLIVGMQTSHGLWQRIDRYGWDHPEILKKTKGRGYTIEGTPTAYNQFKPGMWAGLGEKTRGKNLDKIPGPGTWEARQ